MTHPLLSSLAASTGGTPIHVEVLPPESGETGDWPTWIDSEVAAGFRAQGALHPWRHQCEAFDLLESGLHVALATATGSGKSLVAWAPALTAIRNRPSGRISQHSQSATALYLSPTKALSTDQAEKLKHVLAAGQIDDINVAAVDGDSSSAERKWAQQWADVVLTNPDFLHYSLLPRAKYWNRLIRGVRYIIVDELHAYRGMVGAHVALVVRRLLRLAHRAGAQPQVIVASATAADPATTVATFLGVDPSEVGVVSRSTAPVGERIIVLWQPPLHEESALHEADDSLGSDPREESAEASEQSEQPPARKSSLVEASELLAGLSRLGQRTLVFTRARAAAEAVAEMSRELVPRPLRGKIAAYRGGYLPEERRALEVALRSGTLLGLATTNALELGVDISGLDAVIITGWPGTRASFWQQVGRTGRAGANGLALLVASPDPLDHYLLHHPEHIFGTSVEATVFDPTNPNVLAPHLCAAAAEAPLTEDDLTVFALPDTLLLDELVARGLLRKRSNGWFWNYDRPEQPASLTDLRGSGGQPVAVVEEATGRMVGTVDASRADASVHPGAVYIHQGQTFVVGEYIDDVAIVEPTNAPFRTRAFTQTRVDVLSVDDSFSTGDVTWNYGKVDVRSQVVSFQRRRSPGMEVVGTYPLDMPERMLRTTSVWWTLPAVTLANRGVVSQILPGALHAAEHALIGLLGLVATCDRWDLGGLSTSIHESTLAPTVFVHDAFPGGAGFARRGFEAAGTWVQATLDAVRDCPCEEGCPMCVQSPKCGNGNSPLDKAGAIVVLLVLAEELNQMGRS